jgi:porin
MPVRLVAALVGLGLFLASPASAQPLLERRTLTGDWNGVRPALSAHGVDLYLTYTGTLWGNLHGGRDTGVRWNGYLDFGVEIDLAKLGAWDGLGIHADFHWWQGERPTGDLIGGVRAMALSGWEAVATLRVYNLYLRRAFAGDRLVLKLGQLAADTDFMVSRYGGIFLNAGFGDLPSQNLNLDAPVYPLAAPGLFLQARPLPWLTARFGAYTGDAGDDAAGNHGFGWEIGTNAGGTFFTEVAADGSGWLAGRYTLGGIFDTGGSAQFGTGQERRPHYELYLMVDQALIADDQGNPVLGAFARLSGSPQDVRNVVSVNADAGLTWFGPLPARANDVLGVAVSLFRFTDDFHRRSRTTFGRGQTVLEATYQVAIAPWLVVQPDAQFFFDPAFSARNAQAVGIELVAIF